MRRSLKDEKFFKYIEILNYNVRYFPLNGELSQITAPGQNLRCPTPSVKIPHRLRLDVAVNCGLRPLLTASIIPSKIGNFGRVLRECIPY